LAFPGISILIVTCEVQKSDEWLFTSSRLLELLRMHVQPIMTEPIHVFNLCGIKKYNRKHIIY
jgi:hypothetical protein